MRRHRIHGLLLSVVLVVGACSSSSSGDDSSGASSNTDPRGDTDSGTDDGSGIDDGSDAQLAGVTESSDQILFDLPAGWESETADIESVRAYLLFPSSNADVEQAIVADSSLDGLTAPFFSLDRQRSNPITGPLGGGVRMDPRIQELAYIVLVLSEAPIDDAAPWGTRWSTRDDLMAYSSWNYSGIEDAETTIEMEVAGGPAVAFLSEIEDVANHQYIHVLLTPDKQLLRIEVFPTDSALAGDIESILASLHKGEFGTSFSL